MTTLIVAPDSAAATQLAIARDIPHFLTVTKPEGLRNLTAQDNVIVTPDFLYDLYDADDAAYTGFENAIAAATKRGCTVEKVNGPKETMLNNQLRALLAYADPDAAYIHPGLRGRLQIWFGRFERSPLVTTPAGLAACYLTCVLLILLGWAGLTAQLN